MNMKQPTGLLADGVLIFFLCGVAVAQPLYDVLSRGAEFFVARRSEPIDIVAMVAILSVLLPGALWVALALIDLLNRQARRTLHVVVVSILLSIVFLPALKQIDALPHLAVLLVAGTGGIACGLAFSRWRPRRSRSGTTCLLPRSGCIAGPSM